MSKVTDSALIMVHLRCAFMQPYSSITHNPLWYGSKGIFDSFLMTLEKARIMRPKLTEFFWLYEPKSSIIMNVDIGWHFMQTQTVCDKEVCGINMQFHDTRVPILPHCLTTYSKACRFLLKAKYKANANYIAVNIRMI